MRTKWFRSSQPACPYTIPAIPLQASEQFEQRTGTRASKSRFNLPSRSRTAALYRVLFVASYQDDVSEFHVESPGVDAYRRQSWDADVFDDRILSLRTHMRCHGLMSSHVRCIGWGPAIAQVACEERGIWIVCVLSWFVGFCRAARSHMYTSITCHHLPRFAIGTFPERFVTLPATGIYMSSPRCFEIWKLVLQGEPSEFALSLRFKLPNNIAVSLTGVDYMSLVVSMRPEERVK